MKEGSEINNYLLSTTILINKIFSVLKMATSLTPLKERSELSTLLDKNISKEGLSEEEFERARELIINPDYSSKPCWVCRLFGDLSNEQPPNRAIYDIGLCQGHASYALMARK